MLLTHLRPEGERYLRGEGPRRIRVPGGNSRWPSFAGDAYSFSVAIPLTSVPRFRIMYALCRGEWVRGPALATELGLHPNSVYGALHGMKDMLLVTNRRAAIGWPYSRSRTGGAYAMEWAATEVGRVMLWRFARVSSDLLSFVWGDVGAWLAAGDRGLAEEPGASEAAGISVALAEHLEGLLMRPMGLALANRIMWDKRQTEVELARTMGVARSQIAYRLRAWREKGWIEATPRYDPFDRFHPGVRHAGSWRMTALGWRGVHDHVAALCCAAQTCGYTEEWPEATD